VTDMIDTTEMYLRIIFELEEDGIPPMRARIAERLGHSGPTVSQTVARMERDGLLTVTGDRTLALSESGRLAATRVMRKHRIAERLLVEVLGLEWEFAHAEACRWEHVISDEVERRILRLLGTASRSPYGNEIPGLAELGSGAAGGRAAGAPGAQGDGPTEGRDDERSVLDLLIQAGTDPAGTSRGADRDEAGPGAALDGAEFGPRDGLLVDTQRIGEPVQVDHSTLTLLTAAGLVPGRSARIALVDKEIRAVAEDAAEWVPVTVPAEVAAYVFVLPRG